MSPFLFQPFVQVGLKADSQIVRCLACKTVCICIACICCYFLQPPVVLELTVLELLTSCWNGSSLTIQKLFLALTYERVMRYSICRLT